MGYWGEALTYYHPVWGEEDVAAEKKALDAAPAHPEVTQRELAYLAAARTLVGDGDLRGARRALQRRDAHACTSAGPTTTRRRRSTRWRSSAPSIASRAPFRRQAEAAALSLDVFARNPDHPGAAHYIIHAFDDPDHALLALPAARRYAQIAPEAFHARHMPSHIFVHLGMWTEAAAANESSWAASQTWIAKKKRDTSYGDFHSLSWLQAIYLELGQRQKADEVLARAAQGARGRRRSERPWMRANLRAHGDQERRRERRLGAPRRRSWRRCRADRGDATGAVDDDDAGDEPVAAGECHPAPETDARDGGAARAHVARVAARRGGAGEARTSRGAIAAADTIVGNVAQERQVRRRRGAPPSSSCAGAPPSCAARGRRASSSSREAADLEDRETPSGPIESGVSARERLGEALLAAGRATDALREFRRALELHPRRARVLLGCARAATAANDASAAGYWSELAQVWANADADQPGIDEVRHAVAAR